MTAIKYIATALLIMSSLIAVAQKINTSETTTTDTSATVTDTLKKIKINDVEVIKSFEVKLGEAKRIGVGPKIQATRKVEKTYDYDVTIVPADITYPDPVIKPLAMKPNEKVDADHFYAKLGYGNMKNPYGDISYYHQAPELYSFTLTAHHDGLDNSTNVALQKYNRSTLKLNGDYLINENMILGLALNAGYHMRSLYDTTHNNIIREIDTDRTAIHGAGEFFIKNAEITDNGFSYRLGIGGEYGVISKLLTNGNDDQFGLNANLSVAKTLGNHLTLVLRGRADIDRLHLNEKTLNLTTWQANPGFQFSKGMFNLDATADLVYMNDSLQPFADVELGLAIADESQIYLGVDQEIRGNGMIETFERIPHIQVSGRLLKNTNIKSYYGGVRGLLLDKLSFDISAVYQEISDLAYYENIDLLPTLHIAYLDAKNIKIDGNIEFHLTEHTSIGGLINHSIYELDDNDNLLNIPTFTYQAFAKVGLWDNKVRIKTMLGLKDEISYKAADRSIITGNTMTDLSAEIDFFLAENIALWARGNNLLDRSYLQYAGYPTVGLNAIGGIVVKF